MVPVLIHTIIVPGTSTLNKQINYVKPWWNQFTELYLMTLWSKFMIASEKGQIPSLLEGRRIVIPVLHPSNFILITQMKHFSNNSFNMSFLKLKQLEYETERILWWYSSSPDNQGVLNLIDQKHTGILVMLDKQCVVPQSADEKFTHYLYCKCDKYTWKRERDRLKSKLSDRDTIMTATSSKDI